MQIKFSDVIKKHPRYDIAIMDYNELRAELECARMQIEELRELNKKLYKKLGKTLQKEVRAHVIRA